MPIVRNSGAYYLLHEFLEPHNAPCYFKEFAARAGAHGLTYLADAEPSTMFVQNYGEKVRDPLLRECGGSQIMMEQYLDFLVNRTFRQTLLVKQERASGNPLSPRHPRIRALEYAGVFSAERRRGAHARCARAALPTRYATSRSRCGCRSTRRSPRCSTSAIRRARRPSADCRSLGAHRRAARRGRASGDGDAGRTADPRRGAHPAHAAAGQRLGVGLPAGAGRDAQCARALH